MENHYLLTDFIKTYFLIFVIMKAPKIPSFFKSKEITSFDFKPRYYDKQKERRAQLIKKGKSPLKFKHSNRKHPSQKGRGYRIILLIIILSLLFYKLLIK
mgnify:CR=1 FL=1